jgi:lantibiotic modifying enzyme
MPFLILSMWVAASATAAADPLNDAREIARWLTASGRDLPEGRVWPVDPEKPEVVTHLYSGTSGVVLFFLEAHRLTGEASYLAEARAGADYLLAHLEKTIESEGPGLYTGLAGVGFVLDRMEAATGDERYLEGVVETVELLKAAALPREKGVEWNDVTDVVSGSAGIGLYLLHVERETGLPQALDLAIAAGDRLIDLAQPSGNNGLQWAMSPGYARNMPNFSHGTAGVAYFLASLHQATGERRFLDAAIAGGDYLKSIATVNGDACLLFHHEPEGEELFYLSWCHGPVGTARLFYRLFESTGNDEWMRWVRMSARGILESGIPEKRTPGFWNNVSQCCGSAGVAEFFLSLHRLTKDAEYLAFARRITADLLARGTRDAAGLRFVQAENRTEPQNLQAQTGYMQGAAGIGLWLLRLQAFEKGQSSGYVLPDSPFPP